MQDDISAFKAFCVYFACDRIPVDLVIASRLASDERLYFVPTCSEKRYKVRSDRA